MVICSWMLRHVTIGRLRCRKPTALISIRLVSLSAVISDMLPKIGGSMPDWFSFAKVRASFAEVGNDLDPYQLYNFYSVGKDPNGNTTGETG